MNKKLSPDEEDMLIEEGLEKWRRTNGCKKRKDRRQESN